MRYTGMMDHTSPEAPLKAPLHRFSPQDWARWYPRLAGLLEADDAGIRHSAAERLCMAVFWSEHARAGAARGAAADAARRRAAWLTDIVERASRRHPDLLTAFLGHLRWHGDKEPFPEVLLPWLRDLRQRCPPDVPVEKIEGVTILIGGLDPWEGSRLPPAFDHPSDYVRACAAHMLGRIGFGEAEDAGRGLLDRDFLAELTARELERPGIAGPFWSSFCFSPSDYDDLGFDPLEWMLEIVERRNGPEPAGLPFNGIDFHIHELAASSPEAVRWLIAAGRDDLAAMAATEIRDEVPAMAPVLLELGNHADPGIAFAAQVHLAHYHGKLHPRADLSRIRHLPDWRPGAEAFVIRSGHAGRFADQAVFFPRDRAVFDDAEAWSIVDAALPPELRGELARHYLDSHDAAPAPCRLGRDELRTYASGANVDLRGAVDGPGWRRLEIYGGRLDGWRPMEWTEHAGTP